MRKALLILAVFALLALAGCSSPEQRDDNPLDSDRDLPTGVERIGDAPKSGLFKIVDNSTGVVCYYVDDSDDDAETLSCVTPEVEHGQ